MYQYRQSGDTYVVSIDNHEEIVAALAQFCTEQGILSGRIDGIGAVNSATLRFLDPVTKKYVDRTFDEQMEIAAGNCCSGGEHLRKGRESLSASARDVRPPGLYRGGRTPAVQPGQRGL